jgi:phosphoribosylamine--glycine ligase
VVKEDGLAGGKGVFVCADDDELRAALERVHDLGDRLLFEELLEGDEVSLFALCDGREALALPPARDFKRAHDGDQGPNTGGMGSYSPVAELSERDVEELIATVHRPVLAELARRGAPFVGLLYAGLMLTHAGPRVLEFNCRFGDPETQSIVPRLDGELLAALAAAARGDLGDAALAARSDAAVTVVVAASDYPAGADRGNPIEGIEAAEEAGALVFHAGTAERDGRIVTNGGRILNVTGLGSSLARARDNAYAALEQLAQPGLRYRSDIALTAAREAERVG